MKNLTGLLTFIALTIFSQAFATSKLITGTVADQFSEQPLSGVNIVVQGTDIGTTSNKTGRFTIEVPDGKTVLIFSKKGYMETRQLLREGASKLKVTLRPPGIVPADNMGSIKNETIRSHRTQRAVSGIVTSADSGKGMPGVNVLLKGTTTGTTTGIDGKYKLQVPAGRQTLTFSFVGYNSQDVIIQQGQVSADVKMVTDNNTLSEIVVTGQGVKRSKKALGYAISTVHPSEKSPYRIVERAFADDEDHAYFNTEEYDVIQENTFLNPTKNPLSTFSIDVDAASYSNLRRVINSGQAPYKDIARIEEMINYFNYDYKDPNGEHPFSINTEISYAPWNKKHRLVHIGIQGKKLDYENTDPSNLVFLIDVSGSMSAANKLPLLKSSMKLLINELGEKDKISIVTYAGAAGLVLPPTPASEKEVILSAFERLKSGGSTAGGAGIRLAYKVAEQNLIKDGNNRVILATDGDFNVGVSSTSELIRMIEKKRQSGIYLTITGFGMGNYKDGRMEQISNAGNGNYYYIDNIKEARKVFITEMQATLFTIAKDVKIQVEFNPAKVQAYRLIGYENRKLKAEDFNDDKKDAGELGAGHTVTALYEIIPVGVESTFSSSVDPLKYQQTKKISVPKTNELLTVKFRYKAPNGTKSKLITHALKDKSTPFNSTSDNFRFSAAVAEFGMLLRDSEFKQSASYDHTLALALGSKGKDPHGYRSEFIDLIRSMAAISKSTTN